MTAVADRTDFFRVLQLSTLLDDNRLKALTLDPEFPQDPSTAAEKLVQSGELTRYQAKQLLAGKHRGFILGPYKIVDQIGKGGMGTVFLAEHGGMNKKLALKVLARELANDKAAVDRFQREARAASALTHPNIVRVHHVGSVGDTRYLVMEYVHGATLEQILDRKGPYTIPQAVRIAIQAAEGLQHAHEKGFVHRDIKPENLMLTKDGAVKILDMGLTKSTSKEDNLTGTLNPNLILGTIDYLSPEQAMQGPLDCRSDIYSLGATLFTLITGHSPYEGVPPRQKLMQHQCGPVPNLTTFNFEVPKALAAVVAKMMAKQPGDRQATMAEVIAQLKPFAEAPEGVTDVGMPSGVTSVMISSLRSSMTPTLRNADATTNTLSGTQTNTSRPTSSILPANIALHSSDPSVPVKRSNGKATVDMNIGSPGKNTTMMWFTIGVGIALVGATIAFLALK